MLWWVNGCPSYFITARAALELHAGTHREDATLLITYPESVAPTAISGNNESNNESNISMNKWALQACSSNGSNNALSVLSRAANVGPSNNGARGPGIIEQKNDGILISTRKMKGWSLARARTGYCLAETSHQFRTQHCLFLWCRIRRALCQIAIRKQRVFGGAYERGDLYRCEDGRIEEEREEAGGGVGWTRLSVGFFAA